MRSWIQDRIDAITLRVIQALIRIARIHIP